MREFPLWVSGLRTWLVSMSMWVQSLASLSGLRIPHCHKIQHRPASAAPTRTLAWELSYMACTAPKRKKNSLCSETSSLEYHPISKARKDIHESQAGICRISFLKTSFREKTSRKEFSVSSMKGWVIHMFALDWGLSFEWNATED